MRTICSVFALCSLLASGSAGGPPITIPFEFYANAIWFEAQVNGRGPFHVQFDTAAGRSVLNTSKAKYAGLSVLEEIVQENAGSGTSQHESRCWAIRRSSSTV